MTDTEVAIDELDTRIAALEAASAKRPGIEGMTLAELEALAARLGAAAKTIRDAQSLLGVAGPVPVINSPLTLDLPRTLPSTPIAPIHPGIVNDPESMAIRERLHRQAAMNLPSSGVDPGALND